MEQPKADDGEGEETEQPSTPKKKKQKDTQEGKAEDLLGFRKIDQGIITMEDGRSIRAVIGVDSLNYHSLSDAEQEAVDGSMAGVLASLSFSIQPVSITSPVDLNDYIQKMQKKINMLPDTIQDYAREHMRYLDEETKQEILIKQDYLVVGVDDMADRQQAINELDRRCGLLISGMRRAGHIARVLDTQQASDVFYNVFHSNRVINARLKDALGDEHTSFVVRRDTPVQPHFETQEHARDPHMEQPKPGQGPAQQQDGKKLVML
ncbi:hypothetical protein ACFQ4A_15815 [Lentibacillus salinarum]|uniref:Uncharacterized protein n=2 Tax=Lentibacillus salinarum TaxID=446820 RepID=A0ABW3ZXM3_9BACI